MCFPASSWNFCKQECCEYERENERGKGGWGLRDVSQEVHCLPLSFSTWRALPLQLTSSNGPVSFPLQPAPSLSSGPAHGLQFWEQSENLFSFGVNGWNKFCSLFPGLMWGLENRKGHHHLLLCLCFCWSLRRRRRRRGRITWDEEALWIQQRKGVAIIKENRKRQQHQGINQ